MIKSVFSSLALALFVSRLISASAPQLLSSPSDSHDNSPQCSCYLISGANPGYFQYHRFFDFRSIDPSSSDDFATAPPLVNDPQPLGDPSVTSSFFTTPDFVDDWTIQNFTSDDTSTGGVYPQVDSPQNVYITQNGFSSTYLTLRTNRLHQYQSSAELDWNERNLMHASIRARLRVLPSNSTDSVPSAGAVMGFFIYESDTTESDIEILTRDPINSIRYSNQPDYDPKTGDTVPSASTQFPLNASQTWDQWQEHRLDWFQGLSAWYLNDAFLLNKTINVPKKPSGVILNLWGDGGEWSGQMAVGSEVTVGVEWVEMVFNVSGKVEGPAKYKDRRGLEGRKESSCQVGCWVDGPDVLEKGTPVMAFNTTGNGADTRLVGQNGEVLNLLLVQVVVISLAFALAL